MKVALPILAFALAAQAASVTGMVRSTTGEAIPRATVHLAGRSVIADDGGNFIFENVEPGTYPLRAERPGFVPARYGARSAAAPGVPVAVEPGATVDGLVITLTPHGVLSGRVTDQKGDPVAGATVWVLRRGYLSGIRQLTRTTVGPTDDQGRFRVAELLPGRYYVLALPPEEGIAGGRTGSVRTYYPSSADSQTALPLEVTPGADLVGIDIRLRAGPLYAIRGRVDLSADPGESVSVSAVPADGIAGLGIGVPAGPPDFTFELRDLVPGKYVIRTLGRAFRNGEPSMRSNEGTEVSIGSADVSGLVIPMITNVSVSGTIVVEGGDVETVTASGARPFLRGRPGAAAPVASAGSQVERNGKFRIRGLAPGDYELQMAGLPENVYFKSARLGDQDALRSYINLTRASGEITVVLSNKAAEVRGTVRDDKTVGRMVTLWSKDPEPGTSAKGVHTTYADRDGAFRFPSLPPGEYFAVAWEDADPEMVLSRDFLAEFLDDAVKVTLLEGVRDAIEVKIAGVEKIRAAEEKLP